MLYILAEKKSTFFPYLSSVIIFFFFFYLIMKFFFDFRLMEVMKPYAEMNFNDKNCVLQVTTACLKESTLSSKVQSVS